MVVYTASPFVTLLDSFLEQAFSDESPSARCACGKEGTCKGRCVRNNKGARASCKQACKPTTAQRHGPVYRPPVDVVESDESTTVLVNLPGIAKDAVSLSLARNELTLSGELPSPVSLIEDDAMVTDDEAFEKLDKESAPADGAATSENVDTAPVSGTATPAPTPAEPKEDTQPRKSAAKYAHRERPAGAFQRVIRVPEGLKASHIRASMDNGLLSVSWSKRDLEQEAIKVSIA